MLPDDPADFLADDLLGTGEGSDLTLETRFIPNARAHRAELRRRFARVQEQEGLLDVITRPPAPGEQIHVISGSRFDFWTWCPAMITWLGTTRDVYITTWIVSRNIVTELFEVWDGGKITGRVNVITGLYFKRRETAVYAQLLTGLRKRGGRYRAHPNHAKILLLNNPEQNAWLVVEGSANFTANPQMEQSVITNDRALYEFHRGWMEEVYTE